MGLAQTKILSLKRDSTREHPEFHPRSRLSEITSHLSKNYLAEARYVEKFAQFCLISPFRV